MKRLFGCCLALSAMAGPLVAGGESYVVLQGTRQGPHTLVRVSADGKAVAPIAEVPDGQGLVLNAAGNYIVSAKSKLLRVTPAGAVSTIAEAPGDAEWSAVAVDPSGDFIIADGKLPVLWRVSADGKSVQKLATYDEEHPGNRAPRPVAVAVERSGDYLVLLNGVPFGDYPKLAATRDYRKLATTQCFRITPAGKATEIRLSGIPTKAAASVLSEDNGEFLYTDYAGVETGSALFRASPTGSVTEFARVPRECGPYATAIGLARDHETGDIVASTGLGCLLRISADGSGIGMLARPGTVSFPIAVAVESGK